MRWLAPLLALLALLWAPVALAGEPVVVRGVVTGMEGIEDPVWILAADSQQALFSGQPLAADLIPQDGAYELQIDPPPQQLVVWLLVDRDHDAPDPDDPFVSASPRPLPAGPGAVIEPSLDLRAPSFVAHGEIGAWYPAIVDMRPVWALAAGALVAVLWLLITGVRLRRTPLPEQPPGSSDPPPPTPAAIGPGVAVTLVALTLLGLGLRAGLACVGWSGPLDISEQAWFALAQGGPGDQSFLQRLMNPAALGSFKQALYLALVQLSHRVHPGDPALTRLWSVLAGALTVPAMYGLVRRWGDELEALAASALVATLPLGVFFGAEVSPYSLHLLLVVLGSLLLHRALRESCRRSGLGFAVVSVLAYYLHMLHLVVLAAQLLFAVTVAARCWSAPRQRRSQGFLRLAMVPVIMLITPWQAFVLGGHHYGAAFQRETAAYVVQQLGALELVGFSLGVSAGTPTSLPALALVVGSFWIGGVVLLARRNHPSAALLATIAVGMIAAHAFTIAVMLDTFDGGVNLVPHHLTALQAALIPMSAAAMAWLARRAWVARQAGSLPVAGALLLAACLPLVCGAWSSVVLLRDSGRPDTHKAVAVLRTEAQDGDAYLLLPGFIYDSAVSWQLFGQPASNPMVLPSLRTLVGEPAEGRALLGPLDSLKVPAELLLERPGLERLWVLAFAEDRFGRPKLEYDSPTRQRLAMVEARFEAAQRWSFHRAELTLFQRRADAYDLEEAAVVLDAPLAILAHQRLQGGSRRMPMLPSPGPASGGHEPGPDAMILELDLATPIEAFMALELQAAGLHACVRAELEGCALEQPVPGLLRWISTGPCALQDRATLILDQHRVCRGEVSLTRLELSVAQGEGGQED